MAKKRVGTLAYRQTVNRGFPFRRISLTSKCVGIYRTIACAVTCDSDTVQGISISMRNRSGCHLYVVPQAKLVTPKAILIQTERLRARKPLWGLIDLERLKNNIDARASVWNITGKLFVDFMYAPCEDY